MSRCTKKNCPMVGVSADCDLKDCPYRTEANQSKDTIYRDDAIKAVKRISENYTGKGKRNYHPHIDFIVDELKYCVPSADRPQGEWMETPNHTIKCSNCGAEFTNDVMDDCLTSRVPFPKACPICTARMKGASDE